jgi:hypothetical protein
MKLPNYEPTIDDERRVGIALSELDKLVAWYARATLNGYTIRRETEGWLLIVRVVSVAGPLVSFTAGHSCFSCWRSFLVALGKGNIEWRVDRYA